MTLRPVPKPVKDTTPDDHEAVFHARGSDGALKSAVNILRQIGKVTVESSKQRGDGQLDQTIRIRVYQTARHYSTPPEVPYQDKSGEIYCLRSLDRNHIYKLGESIHSRERLEQVIRTWDERFQLIGVHHCSTNRFAREMWIQNEAVRLGAKALGRELYEAGGWIEEWFRGLPNE